VFCLALLGSTFASFTSAQTAMNAEEIFAKFSKTIVKIKAGGKSGTGFFAQDGRLYTAAHVIQDAFEVEVEFSDGFKTSVSKVVGLDRGQDVAVLMTVDYADKKARETGGAFADYSTVKTGESIFVIGNPKGLSFTITQGIVSSKRKLNDRDVLQVSASVTNGSSGSPVFNRFGDIVGLIKSGIEESNELNFAVPCEVVKNVFGVPLLNLSLSNDAFVLIDEDVAAEVQSMRKSMIALSTELKKLCTELNSFGFVQLETHLKDDGEGNTFLNTCCNIHDLSASTETTIKSLEEVKGVIFLSDLGASFYIVSQIMTDLYEPLEGLLKRKPQYSKKLNEMFDKCYLSAKSLAIEVGYVWMNIRPTS
jgi:Trypsin-like peptidase domain